MSNRRITLDDLDNKYWTGRPMFKKHVIYYHPEHHLIGVLDCYRTEDAWHTGFTEFEYNAPFDYTSNKLDINHRNLKKHGWIKIEEFRGCDE